MCNPSLSFERLVPHLLINCSFPQLKQIHGRLLTSTLFGSPVVSSLLLRRATEFGTMEYAELLFSSTQCHPHVLLYNAMIRGYSYNGPHEHAIELFDEMPQRGLVANNFTYRHVLDACARLRSFGFGKKLHCRVTKEGFDLVPRIGISLLNFYIESDRLIDGWKIFDGLEVKSVGLWNKMISEYVRVGDIEFARRLFDGMPERDLVSWNAMISGYVRATDVESARYLFRKMPVRNVVSWTAMLRVLADSGDLGGARRLFDQMPERNVVSWNCMLSSYTHCGKFRQALDLFMQMQSERIIPDGFTLVAVLSACAHLGEVEIGKWIHLNLLTDGLQLGAIVGTSLLEMYAKCGDIDRAFMVFIKMVRKDVFCWNVMIRAFATHGRINEAMKLFNLMKREGLMLSDFTFMSILFACSHGGLVEEGQTIFYSMEREFNIKPKIEHYGCLIDLLCRGGHIEEAQKAMKEMPYKPDVAMWGALLGGCRVRNDVESAEKVMERIMHLETSEGGVYALLSNMYAASNQWNEAVSAREKMEDKRILKNAGHSVILEAQ